MWLVWLGLGATVDDAALEALAAESDWSGLERAAGEALGHAATAEQRDRYEAIRCAAGLRVLQGRWDATTSADWLALAGRCGDRPEALQARQTAAIAARRAGDAAGAVAVHQDLLAADLSVADQRRNHLDFAQALVAAGRTADAARAFEDAADWLRAHGGRDDRDRRDALWNAALLYDQLGDRRAADALLRTWSTLAGDDPAVDSVRARLAR